MSGISIVVILLVPIAFQVFLLAIKQEKRHKEIMEILKRLESRDKV